MQPNVYRFIICIMKRWVTKMRYMILSHFAPIIITYLTGWNAFGAIVYANVMYRLLKRKLQ